MFRGYRSRALIAATLIAGTTPGMGAAPDRVRILVQIENYAGIPPRTLAAAKAEVEEIFRDAQVSVTWQQSGGDRGHCVTLRIVNLETAAGNPPTSMLGLAVRPRLSAFVFYNRILDVTRRRAVDEGVLIGRVMAHEIGHVLLPPGGHSRYGLMRSDIDVDVTNPSRFTREQAGRIRETLTKSGAGEWVGAVNPNAARSADPPRSPAERARRPQPVRPATGQR